MKMALLFSNRRMFRKTAAICNKATPLAVNKRKKEYLGKISSDDAYTRNKKHQCALNTRDIKKLSVGKKIEHNMKLLNITETLLLQEL